MTNAVEASVSAAIRDMRYLSAIGFLAAGIAACVVIVIVENINDGDETRSTRLDFVAGPSGRPDVFGPGILIPSETSSALPLQPPTDASVDEDGNLVVNSDFLALLDFFLIEQNDDGQAALEDYFSRRLPDHARRQATEIARNYMSYMAEHDRQFAAQNLASRDMSRIANWVVQRARLRALIIGGVASNAWYQNDDAQLRQALDELTDKSGSPDSASARPGKPRWTRTEDAIRHQRYLQGTLEKNLLTYEERRALARRQSGANHLQASIHPD